jgi:hypothetical protein
MDEAEAVPALEPTFEDASNARILFGVKTSPQTMMKEGLSALDINLGAKRDMSRPMFPRMSEEDAEGYAYLRSTELERMRKTEKAMART